MRKTTLLFGLLASAAVAIAAPRTEPDSKDSMHVEYLENLDKMLNLWYIRQNVDSTVLTETFDYDSAVIVPECPDSVYLARLAKMNTLIEQRKR